MADYKYLKENNLFEAHMRFMRAIGESFGYSPIEEADDDQNAQQDQNAGGISQDPMAGGAPGGDPNGGMPPMGDPMAGGAGAPGSDPNGGGMPPAPDAMGGDPNGGGMPPGPDDGMGGDQMGGEMPGMDDIEEGEPEEEDDVIDVDDLTKAQEKTNDKVNSVGKDLGKVDSKIQKLLGAIESLEGMFDKNNQEIADLKAEFEKRNPTQTEKLNLRSLDSYPFKIRPTDYWKEKGENSNYSAYADNEEPTTQEYVITNNDVDDFNEREIADSFSVPDELEQDIKRIFGL
jgi:hypothetical protein